MDSQIAAGYGIEDLDAAAVKRMKLLAAPQFPEQNFFQMSDAEFLVLMGAARTDRKTGEFLLYAGTILLAGKTRRIRELFPHFHLEYSELDVRSGKGWRYRLSDADDLDGEINLVTIYEKVMARLSAAAEEGFSLNNEMRRKTDAEITLHALREALVNAMVHADYEADDASVRIECGERFCTFSNPGKMLVSENDYFDGGISVPRNGLLMQTFRNLGLTRRQGFGGRTIYDMALMRDYRPPQISDSPQRTTLTVWTVSIMDLYEELSENDKSILNILAEYDSGFGLSVSNIKNAISLSDYQIRKSLKALVAKGFVEKFGTEKPTRYISVAEV